MTSGCVGYILKSVVHYTPVNSGRMGASAIPRGSFIGEIGVGHLRRNTTPAVPA